MRKRNKKLFGTLLIILLAVSFAGSSKAGEAPKAMRKRLERRERRKAGRGGDKKLGERLKRKKPTLGMRKEQVVESLGNPRDTKKGVTSSGSVHEQWYYGDASKGTDLCIHFDDGVVTSWKE